VSLGDVVSLGGAEPLGEALPVGVALAGAAPTATTGATVTGAVVAEAAPELGAEVGRSDDVDVHAPSVRTRAGTTTGVHRRTPRRRLVRIADSCTDLLS
jgi:hypothetical protein